MSSLQKKILMISPVMPDMHGAGINRRAAAHVRALAKRGELYLVAYVTGTTSPDIPDHVRDLCAKVEVITYRAAKRVLPPVRLGRPVPGLNVLDDLVNRNRLWNLPATGQIDDAIKRLGVQRFDTCFCFRLKSALAYFRLGSRGEALAQRTVADLDDIESVWWTRTGEALADKLDREWRAIHRMRSERAYKVEAKVLSRFDAAVVCSDGDRDQLLQRMPGANVAVIPNTVELVDIGRRPDELDCINILFVGTMNYQPNIDAVRWFCAEMWPKVRAQSPVDCEFVVVGFDPPKEIVELAETDGIEVTGGVDSVIPYYEAADIIVAPIRFGSGTRIKILEAMAMRRPVVATELSAEGISIRHDHDILIADEADDFAEACLRLIREPDLRRRLADAGETLIASRYTLAATDPVYDTLIG